MTCQQRTSILDGMSVTTLQSQLAALQQAYIDLTSGAKVQVASYSQADGSKTVTYRMGNIGDLTRAILSLQTQIDTLNGLRVNRVRPMSPFWRAR